MIMEYYQADFSIILKKEEKMYYLKVTLQLQKS